MIVLEAANWLVMNFGFLCCIPLPTLLILIATFRYRERKAFEKRARR